MKPNKYDPELPKNIFPLKFKIKNNIKGKIIAINKTKSE